jgi:hypothetical protein
MDTEPEVWRVGRLCPNCGKPEHFGSAYCKPDDPEETFHKASDAINDTVVGMEWCTACGLSLTLNLCTCPKTES